MPRKRRTKVVTSTKTSAPSGDESSSSSSEERKNKLELYLKDFDMRVANCLLQADNECKAMCSAINHAFRMELFKLPKNIREMTRAEFMAKGGSINNTMLHEVTEVVDSMTSSISTKSLAAASQNHTTVSTSQDDSSASETAAIAGATVTKKKAAAKGRKRTTAAAASKRTTRTKSVLGSNQEMNTQDSSGPQQAIRRSTRKTTRNTFVTPAAKTGKARALATGWDTPAITPKFDPRLPVTPSTCVMRAAKRGETIISLSGSPITIPGSSSGGNIGTDGGIITFEDGTALELARKSLEVDMSVNETTRQNIILLQNTLAKILKNCPAS